MQLILNNSHLYCTLNLLQEGMVFFFQISTLQETRYGVKCLPCNQQSAAVEHCVLKDNVSQWKREIQASGTN